MINSLLRDLQPQGIYCDYEHAAFLPLNNTFPESCSKVVSFTRTTIYISICSILIYFEVLSMFLSIFITHACQSLKLATKQLFQNGWCQNSSAPNRRYQTVAEPIACLFYLQYFKVYSWYIQILFENRQRF